MESKRTAKNKYNNLSIYANKNIVEILFRRWINHSVTGILYRVSKSRIYVYLENMYQTKYILSYNSGILYIFFIVSQMEIL